MKVFFLSFLAFVFIAGWSLPGRAQEGKVVSCGTPDDVVVDIDPAYDYCDIHARRQAYQDKHRKYRESLDERRINYEAPRSQAIQAYNEARDALFDEEEEEPENKDSESGEKIAENGDVRKEEFSGISDKKMK